MTAGPPDTPLGRAARVLMRAAGWSERDATDMAREMLDAANAPGAAKPDLRPGPRGDLARFLEDLDKVTRPL